MRIHDSGNEIDVRGVGGKFTFFKVHKYNDRAQNVVRLESNEFNKRFVAVRKQTFKISVGKGGPDCPLTFWRQGQAQAQAQQQQQRQQQPQVRRPVNNKNVNNNNNKSGFNAAYVFARNNRVVVAGPHGKHLRVSPQKGTIRAPKTLKNN